MAAVEPEARAARRADPAGGVLGQHQRALGPPGAHRQRAAVAAPARVARPVDPHVGVHLRMVGERGGRRAEAALERVAPHVLHAPARVLPVHGAAPVGGGVDDERLAADPGRDGEPVPDVGLRPVVVRDVEHEAAHLVHADVGELGGGARGGLPVRRPGLEVDRGVGQLREHVHAVAQQVRAGPCAGAGARQSIVPSESGSKAMITRAEPIASAKAGTSARARVLGRAAAVVVRRAAPALVAHHADQGHLSRRAPRPGCTSAPTPCG